MRCFVL